MLPDQLHHRQSRQLPARGVEGHRRRGGGEAIRLPHRGCVRCVSLRSVPPELRARPPEHGARGRPHVPPGPGSAGPEGRDGRRVGLQPAFHARLPVGDLLRRPRPGPRVPGSAVRGGARSDGCRGPGEHRLPLRAVQEPAAQGSVELRRLAPDHLVLRPGAARGPPEVFRHRGRPAAREAHREDHRGVLPADRGRCAELHIHRWLEAEGAEVYPAAVIVWMDYLLRLGLQRFEDYSGIERGARLKVAAGRAVQAIYRWTVDRLRGALGDLPHELPTSSSCAGSPPHTSTAGSMAARATCWWARRSGRTSTRRRT